MFANLLNSYIESSSYILSTLFPKHIQIILVHLLPINCYFLLFFCQKRPILEIPQFIFMLSADIRHTWCQLFDAADVNYFLLKSSLQVIDIFQDLRYIVSLKEKDQKLKSQVFLYVLLLHTL